MSVPCGSCQAPMPCSCCRTYRGHCNADGYGYPSIGPVKRPGKGKSQVLLHRWVFELLTGVPLLPGECVLHHCDNPPCFFFDHLFKGTQTDNLADMRSKGRGSGGSLPGSANPNAKLTEDQVRAIRSMKGEMSSRLVGAQFDVCGSLVRAIWSGKAWTHA